jgi:hypothetical protein
MSDKEIIAGWEKIKDFKFSGLTESESAMFDQMRRQGQAAEECAFCFPPCKEFPNCKCGRQNAVVYKKYGLR